MSRPTDDRHLDRGASTVVYTCWPWPWGGVACGVTTMLIGVALIAARYLPTAPEVVWGVALVVAGAFTAFWSQRR